MTASATKIGQQAAMANRRLSPGVFALGLTAIFAAIILLARANAYTFPLPNEDDARFFFPSWYLAVHGTLRTPILNAPDGIFWVPHGFYVFLSIFLRIFGPTFQVAHWVSQIATATAIVLVVTAFARLCGSRAFALLCGTLLVSPGVIFSANTVRMEPLILLLVGCGLLLHTYERRVAAAAVFFLGVVVHPALLIGAMLYAAGVVLADVALPLIHKTGLPPLKGRVLTWLVVLAVGVAIGLESVYIFHHLALFHQHMALQIARKAGRKPVTLLVSKRGLLLLVELVIVAVFAVLAYRRRQTDFVRELLPVFLLAVGLSFYATFGREMPYNVYSYCLVPAMFFCLAYRMFPPR